MKKKIAVLVALCVMVTMVASAAAIETGEDTATPVFQRVGFVNAVVTASALNVREGITLDHRIICVLKQGQTVKVFGKIGDWYAIYDPATNCVGVASAKYLKSPGTAPAPAKTQAPAPTKTWAPAPVKTQAPAPVKTQAPAPATTAPVTPTTTPAPGGTQLENVSADEQAMLNLVNKARADAGVGPLAFDSKLQDVARLKAKDMVEKNYFSHQSPTYGSPFDMMRQFNISFKTAGENIAGNQTVQGAFDAWMNSEGHRKNILNGNFNYTGIGIVSGSQYGKIFVQQFIGR